MPLENKTRIKQLKNPLQKDEKRLTHKNKQKYIKSIWDINKFGEVKEIMYDCLRNKEKYNEFELLCDESSEKIQNNVDESLN
jgi:hypothetical protein